MKIGNVKLENPFILAPMAGITDGPFRLICKNFGCSLVYSEMISAKALFYNDKATERLLKIYPDEKPIALQIFGSDIEAISFATKKLEKLENEIIDINMGCPVPKVVKNGDGSALLNDPKLVAQIVKTVVDNTKKPVTVKIRIGWDKDSINAVEIAKIIENNGASAVSVHGRTRDQYYNGVSDWNMIKKVKESVKIPVIGSGDVFSGEAAMRMLNETGCDFVMIARGAFGNPWIFKDALELWKGKDQGELEKHSLDEKFNIINEHFDYVVAEKGESNGVREMRKHIGWYLKGVHGSCEIRRRVNTMTSQAEVRSLIEELKTLK